MAVKAGTAVIVRRNGRVLVGRRKGSHGAGLLAFPGGHIDDTDKSFEQQGAREVEEETGMIVQIVDVDPGRQDVFTTFDILDGEHRYVTAYLLADYVSGGVEVEPDKFKPLEEKCEGWEFMTLDELKSILNEDDEVWIPIDRLLHYRNSIQL